MTCDTPLAVAALGWAMLALIGLRMSVAGHREPETTEEGGRMSEERERYTVVEWESINSRRLVIRLDTHHRLRIEGYPAVVNRILPELKHILREIRDGRLTIEVLEDE